ncbi:hypothetical protein HNO88_003677 [Novosphingobium chloroacetimidivorans]|uniref:Uncharacterized protein n=1 Tax=Novosphingobium chloroacetimidivorans TaxID=1428314 RepID=A0A7W7KDM8_9SPHN|nr:hypothetical protein [Novosphingobium chloroacetimidivorans]MBB4860334.1 hypothetical protein [Novosphingobium chloroacetimidivorans]
MMTLDRYWKGKTAQVQPWPAGADRMLLMSVGTGTAPGVSDDLDENDMHLLFNAKNIPSQLMFLALNEQDPLCRILRECVSGDPIYREVDTLIGLRGPLTGKLFRYVG